MKLLHKTVKNFLRIVLVALVSSQTSMTQETITPQKEPPKKKYFAYLRPEGDYSKLKFSIQSNKKTYRMGEPIFIQAAIRNDSNSKISLCAGRAPVNYLAANKIEMVTDKNERVERTSYGSQIRVIEKGTYSYMSFYSNAFFWLLPGETATMETHPLNVSYDLSRPGKYYITYYRRAVTTDQSIDPPLKSNTIEIQVEGFLFSPYWLKEPGAFGEPKE